MHGCVVRKQNMNRNVKIVVKAPKHMRSGAFCQDVDLFCMEEFPVYATYSNMKMK